MQLHPKKIYLQHYLKGFLFLGQYIKPYRSYISNRTKSNFNKSIIQINKKLRETETIPWHTMKDIQAALNSYLGVLGHSNSFSLTKKSLGQLNNLRFMQFFQFTPNYKKTIINKDFWQWHYSLTYRFIN